MLLRSRFSAVFVAMMILVCFRVVPLVAQNTAPVPTTFEIVSPGDGNAASLINHKYDDAANPEQQNRSIFYGGDFCYRSLNDGEAGPYTNPLGFLGYTGNSLATGVRVAYGNPNNSRLTLGGTEHGDDPAYPTAGWARVYNLPGTRDLATSYDPDDLGSRTATWIVYTGCNGFIAINEGDSLEINITGYIDPNNKMIKGDQALDSDFTGRNLRSEDDTGVPGGSGGISYTAGNLPQGASFGNGKLVWAPSFIQGDGAQDNSVHNGIRFIDANISDGSTFSETIGDTASSGSHIGYGLGELRDSLYVVYFYAHDDYTSAKDSLFILVNDSLANPSPRFTSRTLLRIDSTDTQQTITYNYLQGQPDSALSVWEGDSAIITIYAEDQDELYGETNDPISIGILWNDSLRGVAKGGDTTNAFTGFNQWISRKGTADTLVYDTTSTVDGDGSTTSFRIRLQIPFNLAADNEKADTLVVMVSDGNTIVADTFALKVRNSNRAPIWDGDINSTPSDSALVFSLYPNLAEPDSIQEITAFSLNNNQTDTTYFANYVYDPDILIGDVATNTLTYSASGDHQGSLNQTTGVNIWMPSESDTTTFTFSITAIDNHATDLRSTVQQILFRVAPAPTITGVEPSIGGINTIFTIYGTGFGLYDISGEDKSKVVFYAPTSGGVKQNIEANIISWSKEKVVASVPSGVPNSPLDDQQSYQVPDTIKLSSAIYGGFDTYPFIVITDSTGFENLEVVNVTSSAATIRYRTNFTGADSIVVAASSDTLDIHSAAFVDAAKFNKYPTFVEYNGGMSEIRSSVTVYDDQTSISDGVHVVQLSDLVPGTVYEFIIASAGGYFAADSLRNINGPYRPKKIDRNTSVNNQFLDAFRFRTLPRKDPTAPAYTLVGSVVYSGNPATNSAVTVWVVNQSNPPDTSLPISTTVNSNSHWTVALGNLHNSDGSSFIHSQGDRVLIEVDGAEMGFAQYDTTRGGGTSMTIDTLQLVPFVKYQMKLKTGLNLIALPLKMNWSQPSTAEGFLGLLPGGTPSISRYITSTATQETRYRTISGNYAGAVDYNLEIGGAYFVSVDGKVTPELQGHAFTGDVPTIDFPGAGYYFVSRPAQEGSIFRAWDAYQILQSVTNVTVVNRWNASMQQFEQTLMSGSNQVGTNFSIDPGQGYIFDLAGQSTWNPNSSGALLAGSPGNSSKDAANDQAIVLDLSSRGNSNVAPLLSVSNITSSAAVITWAVSGDDSQPGRIRLSKADGSCENVLLPRPAAGLSENMGRVLVSGLEPETQYVFRIEDAAGIPLEGSQRQGIFTTSKVGIGLQPYTMYGRLIDQSGNALPGMLVLFRLKSAESDAQSEYLSAVSDRNGYWLLNLANLKLEGSGQPFDWSEGDQVWLSVMNSSLRSNYRAEVLPGSPHNIVEGLADGIPGEDAAEKPVPISLPKAFGLAQNFPNPFNPSTTIQYAVPAGSDKVQVRVDVFSLRGSLVATLVEGVHQPGSYQVQWEGTDRVGRQVSSGVYFYRIKAGDYVSTRKMVLLK